MLSWFLVLGFWFTAGIPIHNGLSDPCFDDRLALAPAPLEFPLSLQLNRGVCLQ